MTCIVAIVDGKQVVMGGDSAASDGKELYVRADSKVFRVGSYLIGFTTSFRMGQILRYETKFPEPPAGADVDEMERFLITEVVPVVRASFKEHGFEKTAQFPSTGNENFLQRGQFVGGLFLVGVAGMVFEIREDYQLGRPAAPYSSIGSGAAVAMGALHALNEIADLSLRDRAERALKAAEAYNAVVRGPFQFVE